MQNIQKKHPIDVLWLNERSLIYMGLKEKLSKKLESDIQFVENINTVEEANIIPFNKNTEPVQVLPEFQITMLKAKERLQMLQQFVREMMKEGTDYGLIPGCPKPSLFKSGAEKLSDIFGFSKKVDVINRIEDWDKGLFHYEVKVTLVNKQTGLIEAEGVGCCNSKEKKYKNQDSFTIVNTILKIAKKRAIVDAVLSATRSSDLFTQDIEDMGDTFITSPLRATPPTLPTLPPAAKPYPTNSIPSSLAKPATQRQLSLIFKLVAEKGLTAQAAKTIMINKYGITQSQELSSTQASGFIKFLQQM
jgi:hypothetical protein